MNKSCRSLITSIALLSSIILLNSCSKVTKLSSDYIIKGDQYHKGLNLNDLQEWYTKELFDTFLPNMDKYVIDHEYGGFMCTVDIKTGELLSSNKGVWYEGRGLWVYSFIYNNFKKDKKILEIATKSMSFIMENEPPKGKFWPSAYTREGKVITTTSSDNPWFSEGDIYGNLFIAEGLAEYAIATGEKNYFEQAKSIILDCVDAYDKPTYDFKLAYYSADAPKITGVRVLGHWMILLRSATQILRTQSDSEIESIADRCIEAIMTHHLNDQYNLLNEALNHDLSLPDSEYNQLAYLGHGIETLWMIMDEAKRRNDKDLFRQAMDLFKSHVILAQDNVYGGFFRSLDNVDNNTFKVNKVLWLQEEILIGTLLMIESTGDEWAKQCFSDTYKYVLKNYTREGYKFWIHEGDRKMENVRMNRVEHYHHPRHLMLNLLALRRMS